jgi:two-component system NtrC family sensor kinase
MDRLRRSVGFKLFASIFVSIVVVFLGFTVWTENRTEDAWRRSFDEHARQTSSVIERAVRFGMLLERKEGVHSALEGLASEPGVRAVRIFDKKGKIVFSSEHSELKQRLAKTDVPCSSCHHGDDDDPPPSREPHSRTFRDASGELVMSHIHLIENSRECSNAPCHAHPAKKKVLGVLDLQTRMNVVDEGRRAAQRSTFYTTAIMALVGGLVTAMFIYFFVRRPVQRLVEGTRRVAAAGLDTRLPIKGTGEFTEIAVAFNRMTDDLEQARRRTEQWEAQLQQAVAQKTDELNRAHGKLMQMEKMASLGKLSATVAHELNNPLAGILVYSKLVGRELGADDLAPEGRQEALRCVDVIRREATRCGDIVKNLLTFARQSKTDRAPNSLALIVQRSFQTVEHLIRHAAVDFKLENQLSDDQIWCDPAQIQQALVALMVNAVEAMPSGGELTLTLRDVGDQVEVTLKDSGVGIPPDVLPHVFEPFVTTKEEKGTGLGLAVVYGIVRRHGGQIEAESEPNQGATFRMTLPRKDVTNGDSSDPENEGNHD